MGTFRMKQKLKQKVAEKKQKLAVKVAAKKQKLKAKKEG